MDSAATIQIHDIGSLFPINGKHASKIPDYLKRCRSHQLGLLATAVGWNKGGASYPLAQSASGQAAAALIHILTNIFNVEIAGTVLYMLSDKVLVSGHTMASIDQLGILHR